MHAHISAALVQVQIRKSEIHGKQSMHAAASRTLLPLTASVTFGTLQGVGSAVPVVGVPDPCSMHIHVISLMFSTLNPMPE